MTCRLLGRMTKLVFEIKEKSCVKEWIKVSWMTKCVPTQHGHGRFLSFFFRKWLPKGNWKGEKYVALLVIVKICPSIGTLLFFSRKTLIIWEREGGVNIGPYVNGQLGQGLRLLVGMGVKGSSWTGFEQEACNLESIMTMHDQKFTGHACLTARLSLWYMALRGWPTAPVNMPKITKVFGVYNVTWHVGGRSGKPIIFIHYDWQAFGES